MHDLSLNKAFPQAHHSIGAKSMNITCKCSRMGKIEFKKVKRMVWGHAEGAKRGLGVKGERVGLQIHIALGCRV